jgi:endonuclease/exonuclease/phosphatase family metal-dependent hydrolase
MSTLNKTIFQVVVSTMLISAAGFAQPENGLFKEEKELRVLSYNIQMLPRWIAHLKHGPVKRARLIPAKLIADNIDIIVFQEAFDKHCMRIIGEQLAPHYPYSAGPANDRKCGIKLNSGVMIFSKTPLKTLDSVDFTECEKEDCFARKGALLVETEWDGQPLQIMGTHMEAGGTPVLKSGQYIEIVAMMRKHAKQGVPQLMAGDFNISKGSDVYTSMLATFEMEDGDLTGELQFTSDHLLNDMGGYDPEKRDVIDFVFYKGNGVKPSFIRREVKRYMQRWSPDNEDLSDHFSVLMTLRF